MCLDPKPFESDASESSEKTIKLLLLDSRILLLDPRDGKNCFLSNEE